MDKDKIQEIRDYAEAAANLMPYEDDNVIFSGIEIMELLDHLANKEDEIGRLRAALEFYAEENPVAIDDDNGEIARRALARQSELAGEFTGKIETVKLYPGKALTPEEISNDYLEGKDG